MKTIKLKFVDFWPEFEISNNVFLKFLKEKYNVLLSDNPDYIIYSVFGYEHLRYDCIKIFYTCENIRPDFNICDYAIAFDWMTFEDRYLRYPVYMLYRDDCKRALAKHENPNEVLNNKTGFCNFVYSNSKAHSARMNFFKLLNSYKKVDSGGKYLNNIGYRVKDKLVFQQGYKFSIAFENSMASGYTTEKILQAFAAKTIPIYWGNPNIHKEFNPQSFINCHDFTCFDEALKKVIEVDTNDNLYLEILNTPIYETKACEFFNGEASLRSFLYNIFDQEFNKAGRRSRSSNEKFYERLRAVVLNSRRRQ